VFELQQILSERKDTLESLMTELIIGDIKEIDSFYFNSNDIMSEGLCNVLLKRFEVYDCNIIYVISLENYQDLEKLHNSFDAFKEKYNENQISLINNIDSSVLYVGLECVNLKERLKKHLGYSKSGFVKSLHLSKWIPKNIGLKIELFNIYTCNKEYINFVEKGFKNILNPLFRS